MCGGTEYRERIRLSSDGLSPRVRGNRSRFLRFFVHQRSIPACAGEPLRCRRSSDVAWVYPRVCGGTRSPNALVSPRLGLSPRVRGNRCTIGCGWRCAGSIPACAGEPLAATSPPYPRRVYPRVCGGTGVAACVPLFGRGLSPRVRGNRYRTERLARYKGSIPACAGEPW